MNCSTEKLCRGCNLIKPLHLFSDKQSRCKNCRKLKAKETYKQQHPEVKNTEKQQKIDPKTKFVCECGGLYTYCHKAHHMKTKRHVEVVGVVSTRNNIILPNIDTVIFNKMATLNKLIINCIDHIRKINRAPDNEKQKMKVELTCLQANYTKLRQQLTEILKANEKNFKEYTETKESLLEIIDTKEQYLQEIVDKGKSIYARIEAETNSLFKDELNKELDTIKKERQDTKKDNPIISSIYNIKYVKYCDDAQYIVY